MSNILTQNIHNIEMKLIVSIIENLDETIWNDYSKSNLQNIIWKEINDILPKNNKNYPILQFVLYHYDSSVIEGKYIKERKIKSFDDSVEYEESNSKKVIKNINFELNHIFFHLTKDIKKNIICNNFPELKKLNFSISKETFEYLLKCFNAFRNGISHNNATYCIYYENRFIKEYQFFKNNKHFKVLSWMNIKNEIQKILSKNDQKLNFIDMVNLMTYFDSTTKISKESLLINLYLLFHSYDETLFKDLKDENKKLLCILYTQWTKTI